MIAGEPLKEGDALSLGGESRAIYRAALAVSAARPEDDLATLELTG